MFVSYVYTCTVFALKKEQSLNSTDLTSHFIFLKRRPTKRRARTRWAVPRPQAAHPCPSQHHRIAILHDPHSTPSQLFFLDPDNEMHKNLISSGNKRCRRKRLPQLPRRCPGAPGQVTGRGRGASTSRPPHPSQVPLCSPSEESWKTSSRAVYKTSPLK